MAGRPQQLFFQRARLEWQCLTFTITPGSGANGLQAMVPRNSTSGVLASITGPSGAVTFTVDIIKGVQYAFFSASCRDIYRDLCG